MDPGELNNSGAQFALSGDAVVMDTEPHLKENSDLHINCLVFLS